MTSPRLFVFRNGRAVPFEGSIGRAVLLGLAALGAAALLAAVCLGAFGYWMTRDFGPVPAPVAGPAASGSRIHLDHDHLSRPYRWSGGTGRSSGSRRMGR
jgi:hypothetical protein